MKKLCYWAILICSGAANTQVSGAAEKQDRLQSVQVPAGELLVLTAEGRGVQIYRCERAAEATAWVFVAPEASLSVGDRIIATHGAGPSWRYRDGSAVTGKVVAQLATTTAGAVPQLLLRVTAHQGTERGLLAKVDFIQRADTTGGVAPVGTCEAGASLRVPYSAVYRFYGSAQPSFTKGGAPQDRR